MGTNASSLDPKDIFKEQEKLEERLQLESFILQICINITLAIIISFIFCFLRSKHPTVYESKRTLCKSDSTQRPEPLKQGWFNWIYATLKVTDNVLLQYSSFDAFTFMYYIRTLKKLVMILTLICVSVLLPINIVATYNTGTWPPSPGFGFLTLSAINYPDQNANNDLWYWCPSIACWLFSVIVVTQMIFSSNNFLRIREKYLANMERSPMKLESLISRTLLIRIDRVSQGDENIKYLIDHFSNATCQQIVFGQYNEHTAYLVKEYNDTVKKLEAAVKRNKKSTQQRMSKDIERIERINNQVLTLGRSVQRSRHQLRNANYLFAVYADEGTADQAYMSLKSKTKGKHPVIHQVSYAPHPNDIIWSSMHLDPEGLRLKRWFGHGLFFSFLFVTMIPIGVIAAFSNLVNILRIFHRPNLEELKTILDLMQSYFAPWFMYLLFAMGTRIQRLISRQQACKTESRLEQDTILKTYIFFIVDHLLAFTTFNTMIGILGQMSGLTSDGVQGVRMANYVYQIGKNVASSSIYWINYTCINTVGLLFSLLRPRTLLQKRKKLQEFGFSKNYALVISVFTSTLVYSVTAPIVLPFSLLYFGTAAIAFKYELVYIYCFKMDTCGKVWPLLYCITVASVVIFQLIMVTTLSLKGGLVQVYVLIPLPILTLLSLWYGKYLFRRMSVSVHSNDVFSSERIDVLYRDPVLCEPLESDKLTDTVQSQNEKNPDSVQQDVPFNPYFEDTLEPSAPALNTLFETENVLPVYTN